MFNRQDTKSAKKGLGMENIKENKTCLKEKCLGFTWRTWRLGGKKRSCS
jgi:hypothetical protein